jgi:hypothetical protein
MQEIIVSLDGSLDMDNNSPHWSDRAEDIAVLCRHWQVFVVGWRISASTSPKDAPNMGTRNMHHQKQFTKVSNNALQCYTVGSLRCTVHARRQGSQAVGGGDGCLKWSGAAHNK